MDEKLDDASVEAATSPQRGMITGIVRGFGWTFIWLGVLTLGFVAHQLWITTWFAQQQQSALEVERVEHFATTEIIEVPYQPPGRPEISRDPSGEIVPVPTLKTESSPDAGEAFALIRIPSLERLREGWNVVEGVSLSDLKTGAGHMPHTPLPGQPGNSVISGHRTTYGQPFREFDELEPGDRIEVTTAIGTHFYTVRESIIVQPTALWVTEPREGAWLTLTTCNPTFSARERLVVFAELTEGPNADVILATT